MVARLDVTATLTARRELTPTCYALDLQVEPAMPQPRPGQFVMLGPDPGGRPFWRRAFSVAAYRPGHGTATVELMVREVGEGTALWRRLPLGSRARLLGPLGNGFAPPPSGTRVALVAGGIGLPPLLFHLERPEGEGWTADLLYGAATAEELIEAERCARAAAGCGGELVVATDDGSAGFAGVITAALEERLARGRYHLIRACGPLPMLREVARIAAVHGVPAELALEERMACGVGVCLGCVVPAASGGHHRVCLEGPVFPAEAVRWGEL